MQGSTRLCPGAMTVHCMSASPAILVVCGQHSTLWVCLHLADTNTLHTAYGWRSIASLAAWPARKLNHGAQRGCLECYSCQPRKLSDTTAQVMIAPADAQTGSLRVLAAPPGEASPAALTAQAIALPGRRAVCPQSPLAGPPGRAACPGTGATR